MTIAADRARLEQRPRSLRRVFPRWLTFSVVGAVALAGGATAFGWLSDGHKAPVVKLIWALVIASAGQVVIVGRVRETCADGWSHQRAGLTATAAAFLSMGAALIHFATIREHMADFVLYGVFFIVIAIAQMGWAFLVFGRRTKLVWIGAAAGNGAIVILYVVTRTVGSLIGPEARTPAQLGFGDVLSTTFEALIVCAALFGLRRRDGDLSELRRAANMALLAVAISALTTLGLFSAVGSAPFVPHVG